MPIDIYNKDFQNWLKGVFGLNLTRTSLCACIEDKLNHHLDDIPRSELNQFFECLKANGISQLKTRVKGFKRWECKHQRCRTLMERFLDNHTEKHALKYKWNLQSSSRSDENDHIKEDINWKVIMLYMHIDRNESDEKFTDLECLDISRVIKMMRSCKFLSPDGSGGPFEEVLKARNQLMHSPNNMIKTEEADTIFTMARTLLDCLDITESQYYKKTMQDLKHLTEKDFVIKYQSPECQEIIEKVLQANIIAEELNSGIEDSQCKNQCKSLQDIFGTIIDLLSTTNMKFDMKPSEYKLFVNGMLKKKRETIEQDKAECDEESEEFKVLEDLEQITEQIMKEVEELMQQSESEEMNDVIHSLNDEVEKLKKENMIYRSKVTFLEKFYDDKVSACSIMIQKHVRGWLMRNKYRKLRISAIGVQRYGRGKSARRYAQYLRKVNAATTIQKHWRVYRIRESLLSTHQTVEKLQNETKSDGIEKEHIQSEKTVEMDGNAGLVDDVYKAESDGIKETRVERETRVKNDGDDNIDHDALLRMAIYEVINMNQDLELVKIEAMREIREEEFK